MSMGICLSILLTIGNYMLYSNYILQIIIKLYVIKRNVVKIIDHY